MNDILATINFFVLMMISSLAFSNTKIGETELCLFDSSRNRPVWLYVWYPCESGIERAGTSLFLEPKVVFRGPLPSAKKHPLILFSHGSNGDAKDLIWLAENLVKSGYIVVSVDHYGNNWKEKIPEAYFKFWERPQDISFVLDYILSSSPFQDIVDNDKIGFAGFSLGGMAGIWLAGGTISDSLIPTLDEINECFPGGVDLKIFENFDDTPGKVSYKDPRIKAFFLMAPRFEEFSKNSTIGIELPFFIVFGDSDEYLPLVPKGKRLMENFPSATFHIFRNGASHYSFTRCPTPLGKEKLSHFLEKNHPNVDRQKIHSEAQTLALDFFEDVLTH